MLQCSSRELFRDLGFDFEKWIHMFFRLINPLKIPNITLGNYPTNFRKVRWKTQNNIGMAETFSDLQGTNDDPIFLKDILERLFIYVHI